MSWGLTKEEGEDSLADGADVSVDTRSPWSTGPTWAVVGQTLAVHTLKAIRAGTEIGVPRVSAGASMVTGERGTVRLSLLHRLPHQIMVPLQHTKIFTSLTPTLISNSLYTLVYLKWKKEVFCLQMHTDDSEEKPTWHHMRENSKRSITRDPSWCSTRDADWIQTGCILSSLLSRHISIIVAGNFSFPHLFVGVGVGGCLCA